MKTMVFDVPAESGGALTILNQYYDKAVLDKDNDYIFIVSVVDLKETDNIKVLKYPWIKKSWFHRLFFDNFIAPKIVKKHKPDKILSLQNVGVPFTKVNQTIYLHQVLPFIEYKYKFNENRKYWIYQNIIGRKIKKSITKSDEVIVQTKWLADSIKEFNKNVIIEAPIVNLSNLKQFDKKLFMEQKAFFYPSSLEEYKNHQVVIKALTYLVKKSSTLYFNVLFTVSEQEFKKKYPNLFCDIQTYNLPVCFLGKLTLDEVYEMYSKTILLFPSYIETFGLPLLEARNSNAPIIASSTPFSLEILEGYYKANFFDRRDYVYLSELIYKYLVNND